MMSNNEDANIAETVLLGVAGSHGILRPGASVRVRG